MKDETELQIESEFRSASKIYVDLEFIQHIDLGRVYMSGVSDSDSYNRLVEFTNSDQYKTRITDTVSKLIKIKTDNIPVSDRNVMISAPLLSGLNVLIAFIGAGYENRKKISPESDTKIDVVINTSALPETPKDLLDGLSEAYSDMFDANVVMTPKKLEEYSESEIQTFDTFFLSDLARFNNRFMSIIDSFAFMKNTVFARQTVNDDVYDEFVKLDTEEQFKRVSLMMNPTCDFAYIQESHILETES